MNRRACLEASRLAVPRRSAEDLDEDAMGGGRMARGCGTLGALSNETNGAPHVAIF